MWEIKVYWNSTIYKPKRTQVPRGFSVNTSEISLKQQRRNTLIVSSSASHISLILRAMGKCRLVLMISFLVKALWLERDISIVSDNQRVRQDKE